MIRFISTIRKGWVFVILCFLCFGVSSNQVFAGRAGGMTNSDREELERKDDEYADIILKGKVQGDTKQQIFFLTVMNKETNEQFSYKFAAYNQMIVKGKIPLGSYEIVDGGIENDWTGEYSPQEREFQVDSRSAAKEVIIHFGTYEDDTVSKEKKEKVFQEQQKETSVKKTTETLQEHSSGHGVIAFLMIVLLFVICMSVFIYKKFR